MTPDPGDIRRYGLLAASPQQIEEAIEAMRAEACQRFLALNMFTDPVRSGFTISREHLERMLRWLDGPRAEP